MSNKKSFFEKRENKTAMFIALFAASILYLIETTVWSVETTIRLFLNLSELNSAIFAHTLGVMIALVLLVSFIKKFSEGLDIK